LEAAADGSVAEPLSFELYRDEHEGLILDFRETIRQTMRDISEGQSVYGLANSFHRCLHKSLGEVSRQLREDYGLNRVVLSGGCFQNRFLLEGTIMELRRAGFEVFTHRLVPTNDGGISLGQAVVAAASAGA
jgi:hydrogenase maturation protein HypF